MSYNLSRASVDQPVMMICVKLSRLAHEFNVDGLIDIAGYIECWGIVKDIHPEEEMDS